jgi:hypothetical protein
MLRSILIAGGVLLAQSPVGDSHVFIVSGIGGQPQYSDTFHRWGVAMFDAAAERFGLPAENLVLLTERPERDPERIHARSTKENVEQALDDLAQRVAPTDRIFILLIGHGSSDGAESRFNLPGPDMSAADFAAQLDKFPTQTVAFVNASSASGDFVSALSGPNRVLVTATKTGFERNESIFGEFFVEAFASEGADTDHDERVSILEAFNYARHEVVRRYEDSGRLMTEHALLDDNGDGEGTTNPDSSETDGTLARTLFLDRLGVVASGPASGDSLLVALYNEKRELETRIADLRNLKDQMEQEVYEAELERLLVELALKNRAIREREAVRQ